MKSCIGVLAFLAACATVTAAPPRPATIWRPASPSNFDSTVRNTAAQCDSIVIHTAEGSYFGCISWFQNPAAQASSHYVVAHDGEITQMVQDDNISWTETYYNARSIGIECEGYAGDPNNWTAAQLSSLEDLVAWLASTYNIRTLHPGDDANTYGGYYTNYGLLSHEQIQTPGSAAAAAYGTRTDPGSYFPWAEFVAQVNARINGGSPAPAPTNLQATVDGPTQVSFSWDASAGATGYYVDIAESSADLQNMTGTFQNHANGGATSYAWAGLSPGTTYYWRVWAYNASGGNHGYPAGPVTTPVLPPSAPTNLRAVASLNGAGANVAFSWDASPGATGYYVDIAESSADLQGMTGTFQNHNNADATSYTWAGLAQGTTWYWRVWAYNGSGGNHGYPGGPVTTPREKRLVVGLGTGGNGRVEVFDGGFAHEAWASEQWTAYNAANGTLMPACGDLKGDGKEEIVCGLGTYTPSGGWVAVLDNTTYALLKWIRIPWSGYNVADGETRTAVGDFDGDGNAEIAVGISSYSASGGWVYLFGGAQANYAYQRTVRIPWSAYNAANGSTRPAIGDLDGDGKAELCVGLGSYPGQGGWCAIFGDAAAGFALRKWVRFDWTAYNMANGDVRPACGDLDGDGRADLVLGMGSYAGGGYARVLSDANANFAPLGWMHVNWSAYNSSNGETRPAINDEVGSTHHQVALGLGRNGADGYLYIGGDASQAFAGQRWVHSTDNAYNAANGETWPAFGMVR